MIRIANYSSAPFSGWVRTTCDSLPAPAGKALDIGGHLAVVGREIGMAAVVVDIHADLASGQVLHLNPNDAKPGAAWSLQPLPSDPEAEFGSLPKANGIPLPLVSAVPDGAAYLCEFAGRVTTMLHVRMWAWWYPDQPGWCRGEIVVTASNCESPDLTEFLPYGLRITFGDAVVFIPGTAAGMFLPPQTRMGDGQARATPVVFAWPKKLTLGAWSSVVSEHYAQIRAVGIERPWSGGMPMEPRGLLQMAKDASAVAVQHLQSWGAGPWGPNARSGDTGAQEDQVFVGGELRLVGAEWPRYLAALGMARRPCHHLEADGSLLDVAQHPQLVLWDGRPHYRADISPDQLGKPRALDPDGGETKGWWGPDVEHWLLNSLAVATAATGSPVCQWLLRAQANVYLLQWRVPGYAFAARAIGWEAIGVVHLWRCLEDRDLAQRVRQRWRERWERVILPAVAARRLWDVRVDDPRLGTGEWWIPWQQAVGAYGLWLAGKQFLSPSALLIGVEAARAVLRDGWVRDAAGVWQSCFQRPVAAADPQQFDGSANDFGLPLAVAVVRLSDLGDEQARSIWDQLLQTGSGKWFPPEAL